MWLLVPVAFAGTEFDRTLPASGEPTLALTVVCGTVRITGSDQPSIRLHGRSDGEPPEVRTVEGRVVAVVGAGARGEACAAVEVEVPARTAIEVETVSAGVSVSRVTGPIDVESISGAVDLHAASPRVVVETVSGAITVTGPVPRQDLAAVSGSIRVVGGGGRLEVANVSGAIVVEGGLPFEDVELSTASGAIEVTAALARDGALSAQTMSGSIRLALPHDVGAVVTASTASGTVTSGFGPTTGTALATTLGSGHGAIALSTMSGAIDLERR